MEHAARQGFVHPLVVALIARSLQRLAPSLVPPDYDFDALLRSETVPVTRKFELLDAAWRHGGARLLLRIGGVLHDPQLPPQPVLLLLQNISSMQDFVQKYQQLWRALNTSNRVNVIEMDGRHAIVEHVVASGGLPEAVESLHTCGLGTAMVELLGAVDLEVQLVHDASSSSLVYKNGEYFEPEPGKVNRWLFRWSAFAPRRRIAGLDEYLHSTARLPPLEDTLEPAHRVAQLIREAPAKAWTVAAAAHELGLSARSLQRALAAERTTFTELLWRTRVVLAQERLRKDDRTVSEVARELGFSDAAHLSRRFSAATGVPPTEWRRGGR